MFASTVRKGGQNAAPRVVPRRNVPRKQIATGTVDVRAVAPLVDSTQGRSVSRSPAPSVTALGATAQEELPQPQVGDHPQQSSQYSRDVAPGTTNIPDVRSTPSSDVTAKRPIRPSSEILEQEEPIPSAETRTTVSLQVQDQEVHLHEASAAPPRPSEIVTASVTAILSSGERETQPTQDRAPSEVSHVSSATEEFDSVTARLKNLQHNLRRAGRASQPYYRLPSAGVSQIDTAFPTNEDASDSRPRKRRKKNTIQDQVDSIVANATRSNGRARTRASTPQDAETRELTPSTTTMGDLLSHSSSKLGKKSTIEKAMAENWPEILRRRKEEAAARLKAAQDGRRKRGGGNLADDPPLDTEQEQQVVQQVIENGQIVVVNREIDRAARLQASAQLIREDEIQDDELIYRRVNQSTIGSKQQIAPGAVWDDQATELFYQGMTMFGTDFKMISNMIPGKNRRQVKLKYNVEEKTNWERIKHSLGRRKEVELDKYAEMTGIEFQSAEDVYKQMAEDEKALRAADEQRRRDEGIISKKPVDSSVTAPSGPAERADGARVPAQNGEADTPLPSVERGVNTEHVSTSSLHRGDTAVPAPARTSGAPTTSTATTTAAAKKKAQRKRKVDKYGGGGQEYFEGVEERVGEVGDGDG